MKIHKQISDRPYYRDEQFTRYRWVLTCEKKGHKTLRFTRGKLWKMEEEFKAKGYHCHIKLVDPAYIL